MVKIGGQIFILDFVLPKYLKQKGAERAPWIVEFSFSSYFPLCRDS